jgi:subtilisin-like proprotein convertase family protein
MKTKLLISAVTLAAGLAQATIVVDNWSSGTLNTAIPDGNPVGITSSTTFSGLDASAINEVDVTLTISGGYNGDLYGYLVLQSADSSTTTSILLNRVGRTDASGFGYSASGLSGVVLSGDTGQSYSNIHGVSSPSAGGTYLADGRTTDPNGDFTGSSSTAGLEILNGHNANGTWTLFLADLASGDQGTLTSWNLTVSVVPEPVTVALGVFGLALGGLMVRRHRAQV